MTFACHTLAHLRSFVATVSATRAHLPGTLLLLQLAALGEEGLPGDVLSRIEKNYLLRKWQGHYRYDPKSGHFLAAPSLLPALGLPSPDVAASVRRALRFLLQKSGLSTSHIATLIWTSQPGGMYRAALQHLGWACGKGGAAESYTTLLQLGLVRPLAPHEITDTQLTSRAKLHTLTETGQKLLLGHWGKAAGLPLPPPEQIPPPITAHTPASIAHLIPPFQSQAA